MVLGHEIKILGFIVDYKFTDISLERGLKYVSAKKDQLSKSVGGDVFHYKGNFAVHKADGFFRAGVVYNGIVVPGILLKLQSHKSYQPLTCLESLILKSEWESGDMGTILQNPVSNLTYRAELHIIFLLGFIHKDIV